MLSAMSMAPPPGGSQGDDGFESEATTLVEVLTTEALPELKNIAGEAGSQRWSGQTRGQLVTAQQACYPPCKSSSYGPTYSHQRARSCCYLMVICV